MKNTGPGDRQAKVFFFVLNIVLATLKLIRGINKNSILIRGYKTFPLNLD